MYNTGLFTYINIRTYMHTHWKPINPLCSWVWLRSCFKCNEKGSRFLDFNQQ